MAAIYTNSTYYFIDETPQEVTTGQFYIGATTHTRIKSYNTPVV